jgi:hypothetical protein
LAATKLLVTFPLICNDLVATKCKTTLHFKGIYLVPSIYNFIIRTLDIAIWQPPNGYLPPLQTYQSSGHRIVTSLLSEASGDQIITSLRSDVGKDLLTTKSSFPSGVTLIMICWPLDLHFLKE